MIFITGQCLLWGYDLPWKELLVKETYFTLDSLASTTQHMLEECQSETQRRRLPFQPVQSALLVLDMQAYFLEPDSHAFIPSAPPIIPGLVQLSQAYFTRSLPVFFTRHVNTSQDAGQMATWWRELIAPGSPTSTIVPDFDLSSGQVIEKSQYDAFFNSSLADSLAARQVRQVVIGGVMTHLCCETTARSAFMRGFEVFFLADGTATYNRAFHQASLLNLGHGFATILRVEDILADLEKVS